MSGSPADRAGLRAGDVLGAAGGRRCFSQTDFRGALHRGPRGAGEIEVWWTRGGAAMSGKLAVAEGWRKTVLNWRMSVSQGIVGGEPGFFPLAIKSQRQKLKIPADKMAIEPYMGNNTNSHAYQAGLRGRDIVTAVNGESPNVAGREFLVWFKQRFDPGDRVKLSVVGGNGEQREVTYQLPPRGK